MLGYIRKSAILYGDNRISFSDYKNLCDQCAANLINEAIVVGDRIAVLSSNSDEFLILYGAAAKIGAIVVPVNYRLNEGEEEYILKDSTPKYIFSSEEYKDLARKASLTVDSIQKHYVFKTDRSDDKFIHFGTLLRDVKIMQSTAVSGHDAYMIIYTAAVGGKPRGCVLSQANLLAVGIQMGQMFKLTKSDCHVDTLPLFSNFFKGSSEEKKLDGLSSGFVNPSPLKWFVGF